MATWTAEKRKAHPLKYFGDPTHRAFPIADQEDVEHAAMLLHHAKNPAAVKARIVRIVHELGLKLPKAWEAGGTVAASARGGGRVALHSALEAGSRRVEGDFAVYPDALLWVAGDYPDKRYSMSPEENWLAVDSFEGAVWGNIEHTDFLEGRACEIRSIRLDEGDAAVIRAEIAVPLALDSVLGDTERGLSAEWDRRDKRLVGVALTTNPRVPEAALMRDEALVSFAVGGAMAGGDAHTHTHEHGDDHDADDARYAAGYGHGHDHAHTHADGKAHAHPHVHTHAAPHGHGHAHAGGAHSHQHTHDHTAASGHGHDSVDAVGYDPAAERAAPGRAILSGSRHSAADRADMQAIHDIALRQGAACGPTSMSGAGGSGASSGAQAQRRGQVGLRSQFAEWFRVGRSGRDLARQAGATLPEEDQFALVEDVAADAAAEEAKRVRDAELAKLAAEREEARKERDLAKAEMHRARAERAQAEAVAFADGLIAGHKILPGEKEGVVALFVQAVADDAESKATFSGKEGGSRVEQIKALFAARQAHQLTTEQLDPKASFVLAGDPAGAQAADVSAPTPEGQKPSPARIKHLVALANGQQKAEG